jgi:hypothetical protein
MRKSIFVITLLASSFLPPSWGLASLKGTAFCCADPLLAASVPAEAQALPDPPPQASLPALLGSGPGADLSASAQPSAAAGQDTHGGRHAGPAAHRDRQDSPAAHESRHAGPASHGDRQNYPAAHESPHAGSASHGDRGHVPAGRVANSANHASGPAGDPASRSHELPSEDAAQAGHPSCGLLSCAQAPTAAMPEAFPFMLQAAAATSFPALELARLSPFPPALFHPPRP